MKSLIITLCFIIPIFSNAQNTSSDNKTGLSEVELKHAKDLYATMMKSDNYIQSRKYMREFATKTYKAGPMEEKPTKAGDRLTPEEAEQFITNWLSAHLPETQFQTVAEGVALYMKGVNFGVQSIEENPELYALIRKADRTQRRGIWKAETDELPTYIAPY